MIRDRITEVRRVKASELLPHPQQFRSHLDPQRSAVEGSLDTLGQIIPLPVYLGSDGRLTLIDGHLRTDIAGDREVSVAITDLSPEEARLGIRLLDPLAAMAEENEGLLEALNARINADVEAGLLKLGEGLAGLLAGGNGVDPQAEWQGMPEFTQEDETAHRTVRVHFEDEAAVQEFQRLIGQEFSPKALYIWHPRLRKDDAMARRYANES